MMMKAGHIVDRGSPQELIARYGRANLEEVFLHIARERETELEPINEPVSSADIGGSLGRVWAMLLRYLYLLRSSWPRTLELFYWPTLQMLIWGFMSQFLYDEQQLCVPRLRRSPGRGDAVGRTVPRAARLVDVVPRRNVGAQSRASLRHPVAALRVGRVAIVDEHDPGTARPRTGGAAGDPAVSLFDLRAGAAAGRVLRRAVDDGLGAWDWQSAA